MKEIYQQLQYVASIFRNVSRKYPYNSIPQEFRWVFAKHFWISETSENIEIAFREKYADFVPGQRHVHVVDRERLRVTKIPRTYLHMSDRDLTKLFRAKQRKEYQEILEGKLARVKETHTKLISQQKDLEKQIADENVTQQKLEQKLHEFIRFRNQKHDLYPWEKNYEKTF